MGPIRRMGGLPKSTYYRYVKRLTSSSATEPIGTQSQDDTEDLTTQDDNSNNTPEIHNELEHPIVATDIVSGDADTDTCVLSLMEIVNNHCMSDACLRDVLRLIKHCRLRNEYPPSTILQFNNACGLNSFKASYNWLCTKCQKVNAHDLFHQPIQHIICCGESPKPSSSHFVLIDVEPVLQNMLPILQEVISTEFVKSSYIKSLREAQGYADKVDLTVALNTDGASFFKSSKSSAWPILGTINELPCHVKKKNVILFGVWIGHTKPDFNILLEPIVNTLNNLSSTGIQWKDFQGVSITTRLLTSHMCCDSIARPPVQGISQFNAKYGCGYCLQYSPGHYFLYEDPGNTKLRTHAEHLDILHSLNTNENYGVKQASVLLNLSNFDIIQGFPIDVMHCVYLGVVKQFTISWASTSSKFHWTSEQASEISTALMSIKPPCRVSRTPRPISMIRLYKAHEWSMWLFYYSPVLLSGRMPDNIYQHWLHLVRGISLISNCFSETDLNNSARELNTFCREVEAIYGTNNCTFNVHMLLHLSFFADRYGPLYLCSMFDFENFNHIIGRYITSTQSISSQITKRYLRNLLLKRKQGQKPESLIRIPRNNEVRISQCFLYLKTFYKSKGEELHAMEEVGLNILELSFFNKAELANGVVVHSANYSKVISRNNCVVSLLNSCKAIEVCVFLHSTTNQKGYALGIVHTLAPAPFIKLNYINVSVISQVEVVPLDLLDRILIKISDRNTNYFMQFINNVDNNAN